MFIFLSSFFIQHASALSCEYGPTKSFPSGYIEDTLILPANFEGAMWFAQIDTSSMDWYLQNEAGDVTEVTTRQLEHKGSEATMLMGGELKGLKS